MSSHLSIVSDAEFEAMKTRLLLAKDEFDEQLREMDLTRGQRLRRWQAFLLEQYLLADTIREQDERRESRKEFLKELGIVEKSA